MPNKLSQFWQELKRRNVVRVITVYTAVSLAILELVSNISEPFGLPDWTLKLAFVFLIIGLIIAVILSWIYDIHPKEGIVKTEPVDQIKAEEIQKSSNSWKIASYISFVVIVGLIVLNIITHNTKGEISEILDKSIAVLPFHNDSPDQENDYFINGTMESILNNLCKIGDLRVISRSSVEQYRDSTVFIPDAATYLNVSYILEGSMQKYDRQIRLTLQLIDKNDRHVWSEQYDREIKTPEESFSLQSEIAELVASALHIVISPKERELIERIPTTNAIAFEFYQKGMDEFWKYSHIKDNRESLRNAETLLRHALEYDPNLAQAYAGLARVYFNLNEDLESYLTEYFLDTVQFLADRSISIDPQISEAYSVKGDYYRELYQVELALSSYNKALEINPNDWSAYLGMALMYYNDDLLKVIQNAEKAVSRYHGPRLPDLLWILGYTYQAAGFREQGEKYYKELARFYGDSVAFHLGLSDWWWMNGDYESMLEFGYKNNWQESNDPDNIRDLATYLSLSQQYDKAAQYYEEWIHTTKASENLLILNETHRIGYAFWMNGDKENGAYYLNRQIEICENSIKLGRDWSGKLYLNYDLAAVYSFLENRDKAYENLRIFNQRDKMPLWIVSLIKRDPLFNSIRNEPEFQQIVRDVEAKYQAEHERVRQWLEENDML